MSAQEIPPELDRHLAFESVFNFRDLGGYAGAGGRRVRWRTVFRADGLHHLSEPDLVRFADLGIKTVLDLRTAIELEERGRVGAVHITYHHLPVIAKTWDPEESRPEADPVRFLADRYLDMLEEGRAALGTALAVIADEAHVPLVFHCAAGKDRTGVLAALTLGLLGVSDADIAADYGLSRPGMERMIAWFRATRPDLVDKMADQPAWYGLAPDEAMVLFLSDLRSRYGSIARYASTIGIAAATVAALRAHLLT